MSNTSSDFMTFLKIAEEAICSRHSMAPFKELFEAMILFADLIATGSISEPTKIHPLCQELVGRDSLREYPN